jgi:hypothetical protein
MTSRVPVLGRRDNCSQRIEERSVPYPSQKSKYQTRHRIQTKIDGEPKKKIFIHSNNSTKISSHAPGAARPQTPLADPFQRGAIESRTQGIH